MSLLTRTRALVRYISILIFDFGPEKLPGLSRNGSLVCIEFIWIVSTFLRREEKDDWDVSEVTNINFFPSMGKVL